MKRIRTHLTPVLISAIVLGIAAGVVFAASVHFKKSPALTATNNGPALTLTVSGVQDSAGNTYALAIGPTSGTGLQQSIYYANNIVGAATNTVTVTFSQAAAYPDVRVLESVPFVMKGGKIVKDELHRR